MISVEYRLPLLGLGTDFSEFERPITFATTYTNRYRNITGGAERRPGMSIFGARVSGNPNLTRLHEFVSTTGVDTLLASDDQGKAYIFNSAGSASVAVSGKSQVRMISAQADEKLIFVNGTDRNFYTDDAGVTFKELKALITQGDLAGGSSATSVVDGDVSNWIGATLVSNNDIVYNVTQGGYGLVTTVASAALTITPIAALGTGAGRTNSGADQQSGDVYQLIDYVDMNIIPRSDGTKDNVAIATTGTTTGVVAVSGVNFANTEIRAGDIVYNSTQTAIALVGSVSANVNYAALPNGGPAQAIISGQAVGDSLVFFKSAMPIASWVHVHYGRVAYLDSRNQNRIVWSAPDDPQDVTTYQKTLDTTSFSFGTQQPTGDALLTMSSFQKYFVVAGKRNLFIYQGVTPIQDTSTTDLDFTPVSFYPNGVASRFGLGTNGSDLLQVTVDGLHSINISDSSNTTIQNDASIQVRKPITDAILASNANDIQFAFYPRKSWAINKIGDTCWILNATPSYNDAGELLPVSSWHKFTGAWGQQNHYFVRRNGDLLACGNGGYVWRMDASAATDNGTPIATDLKTAWLRLEEPQKTKRIKQGQYISPVFESDTGIAYTINAVAGWDGFSTDSIVVSAVGAGQIGTAIVGTTPIGAGNFAQASKFPFRWRGEQVRVQFTTESSAAPDIIAGFNLYGSIAGIR